MQLLFKFQVTDSDAAMYPAIPPIWMAEAGSCRDPKFETYIGRIWLFQDPTLKQPSIL